MKRLQTKLSHGHLKYKLTLTNNGVRYTKKSKNNPPMYDNIVGDYVSTFEVKGKRMVQVEPEALTMIAEQAMIDIAHLLRPAHLQV